MDGTEEPRTPDLSVHILTLTPPLMSQPSSILSLSLPLSPSLSPYVKPGHTIYRQINMQALSAAVGFVGLWRRKFRNNILQHAEEQMINIDWLSRSRKYWHCGGTMSQTDQ